MNFYKELLIYSMIIIAGTLTLVCVPLNVNVDNGRFPVKSVEFIKKNDLKGNLLVLFNWGSYALWKLYPQCLISIDGRYEEVYETSLVNESARFQNLGKDWTDFMKNHKAELILLDKSYPVFGELLSHNDWKIIFQDEVSGVFIPVENNRDKWVQPPGGLNFDFKAFESDIADL